MGKVNGSLQALVVKQCNEFFFCKPESWFPFLSKLKRHFIIFPNSAHQHHATRISFPQVSRTISTRSPTYKHDRDRASVFGRRFSLVAPFDRTSRVLFCGFRIFVFFFVLRWFVYPVRRFVACGAVSTFAKPNLSKLAPACWCELFLLFRGPRGFRKGCVWVLGCALLH